MQDMVRINALNCGHIRIRRLPHANRSFCFQVSLHQSIIMLSVLLRGPSAQAVTRSTRHETCLCTPAAHIRDIGVSA